MKEKLTLSLSGDPTAPARARTALRSLERTLGEVRRDVELLVSELITNSVIHAGADRVELQAISGTNRVRIEVSDPGPGFDPARARREPSLSGEGGYGLNIIDELADRWGVTGNGHSRVWLEIDRPPARRGRFQSKETGAAGTESPHFASS